MLSYVEVTPASQSLLPFSCARCMWWQTAGSPKNEGSSAFTRRKGWLERAAGSWGSTGVVALDGRETVASIQFAPVYMLPRTLSLPPGSPPRSGPTRQEILLFCPRARLGRPAVESSRLLQRALADLYRRGFREVYAYAVALGSAEVCGSRNLCGLEFLERAGFQVAGKDGGVHLMRVELGGVLPVLTHAFRRVWRHRGEATVPSPVTYLPRSG